MPSGYRYGSSVHCTWLVDCKAFIGKRPETRDAAGTHSLRGIAMTGTVCPSRPPEPDHEAMPRPSPISQSCIRLLDMLTIGFRDTL